MRRGPGGAARGGRSSPRNRKEAAPASACSGCAALETAATAPAGTELQGALRFCKGCEERLAGAFLSKRVEVLWPDDAVWYGGRVHDYDAVSGRHRVWYDDGEWEFVHLSEQELRFLDPVVLCGAGAAGAATEPTEPTEEEEGGGVAKP